MNPLLYLLTNGLAVYISAYVLPGVHVNDFFAAVVTAVILGLINMTLKPILLFLTLPINILTLGLFTLILNGFMVIITSNIVPGFAVDSVWSAILFSLVLSLVSSLFNWVKKE